MKIDLPYGETTIAAELPDETRLFSNVERASLPPVEDLEGAVSTALAAPRGLPRIGALVRPGATVTIAFDDHTTGSFGPIRRVAIRAVLEELEAAGVRRRDVTLICASAEDTHGNRRRRGCQAEARQAQAGAGNLYPLAHAP